MMGDLLQKLADAKAAGWREWIRTEADERAVCEGCWFDLAAAERVRTFFTKYLRHSKGQWAKQPFALMDWQWLQVVAPLFGWKRADGTRRYRRGYIEVPKKNGKALALDTPIPTPSGWTTMGEIQVGDEVFNENGQRCRVIAATETMHAHECYRLRFSDGTEIVADADHQWRTIARRTCGVKGKRTSGPVGIRTTRQIAQNVRVEWKGSEGSNHAVPIALPLICKPLNLEIPPYVLGTWLGDGTSAGAYVTCGYKDLEIIEQIRLSGVPAHERKSSNRNSGKFLIGSNGRRTRHRDSLTRKLRNLGLIGAKHIPPHYLRASFSQRLALLQGLMDTDGHVTPNGELEFTTTSERLRDGFLELVRSLGCKPTLTSGRAMLYAKDCGPKYRIRFCAFADAPAFRLPRKLGRLKTRIRGKSPRSQTRHIVACDRVESVPVRCIEVDSPSHLFLAGRGMVPTHNSTLFSGLSLYLLVGDREPGAEVYSAAVDRDQASIVFNEAANMVETSHAFKDRLSVIRSTKRITFLQKHSVYRALSADVPAKEGLNAHAVLIDELHAQKSREMWDTLRYSVASRRQPLHLSITTAGYERHSICWEQHYYAEQVLSGLIDDSAFFGLIYAAAPDDDWTDPDVWKKANPGFGITVNEDQFAEDCREAQESPAKENSFRRYRLNQWVESETRWLSLEKWDACDAQVADLAGKPCWAGLDLSSTTDLSAFVLVFPIDDHYAVLPFFWVPEEGARRRERRDRAPYMQWIKDGLIQATAGEAVDYDRIRKRINELGQLYSIKQIAIDRWNATQLATQLEGDGFEMVQFGQGYVSMNSPTKKLEQLVLSEQLAHGGNPVLRWMANNVSLETDAADNWKPSKKKSRERIDGIVALIMALGMAEQHPDVEETPWGFYV